MTSGWWVDATDAAGSIVIDVQRRVFFRLLAGIPPAPAKSVEECCWEDDGGALDPGREPWEHIEL